MKLNKGEWFFAGFVLVLFTLMYISEIVNDRFWLNDFKVYYLATKSLMAGDPIYGVPFGLDTGFYKYSPSILVLFIPLSLLPFQIAASSFFYLVTLTLTASLIWYQRLIRKSFSWYRGNYLWPLFFTLLAGVVALVRELHLGNTNLLLVWTALGFVVFYLNEKKWLSAVLFSLIVLTKPYLGILIFPLILQRDFRFLIQAGISLLAISSSLLLITGFDSAVNLHHSWILEMMRHSSYLESHHTIGYLLERYFGLELVSYFWLFALALCSFAISFWFRKRFTEQDQWLTLSACFSLAMAPSFLITDTEHFLFSLPLILWLIVRVQQRAERWESLGLTILLFAFGCNSSDLWGNEISTWIEETGILGIANLGLLSMGVYTSSKPIGRIAN